MHYRLNQIESQYSDADLDAGSALYDADNVKLVQSVSGYHRFEVYDAQTYEVVAECPATVVRSIECDCGEAGKIEEIGKIGEIGCRHVVAVALMLRARYDERKRLASLPKKVTSIRLGDVVGKLSSADLQRIVIRQARRNRHFAIRLKSEFIDAVEVSPDINKYDLLLGEILTIQPNGKIILTRTEQRLLAHVGAQLVDRAAHLIGLKAYREATDLLMPLITRHHQYIDKIPSEARMDDKIPTHIRNTTNAQIMREVLKQEQIVELQMTQINKNLLRGYQLLGVLLREPVPPVLRFEIVQWALETLRRSYYRMPSYQVNLVAQLNEVSLDIKEYNALRSIVLEKVNVGQSQVLWWASWLDEMSE